MSIESPAGRLARLRAEFDATFARAPAPPEAEREVLLRVRAGGQVLAVPLRQVDGLHRLPRVVPLPGAPPGLLGLCGLHGQLVAAHDLAALLGLSGAAAPRWLLVGGGGQPVGLAAEAFEGQLRATTAQLQPRAGAPLPHVRQSVLVEGAPPLPLLDVESLARTLLEGARAPQERR